MKSSSLQAGFSFMNLIGGIMGGLAFGPLLALLLLIFVSISFGFIHIFLSTIGFFLGFMFGYKNSSEVIFRALAAIVIVAIVYLFKRF